MATKHPGQFKTQIRWNSSRNEYDVLYTGKYAVHAMVIFNPNFNGDLKWRVLYFKALEVENNLITSRIWNPNNEDPNAANSPITIQTIPDWIGNPNDDLPRIFCSGHVFLSDGKLLVAGGQREQSPPVWARGLYYAYIFDPYSGSEGEWIFASPDDPPAHMADGRWYPTLTLLADGKVLAMSGYRYDYAPSPPAPPETLVVNDDPEIYDPSNGTWNFVNETKAKMPPEVQVLYPGAHLVPFGQYAGMVFYSMPQIQAWMFDPTGNSGDYWHKIGTERTDGRGGGCSVLLPLHYSNTDAEVMILGGGHPGSKTVEIINLSDNDPDWNGLPDMTFGRTHANAVIAADGNIIVIGGNIEGLIDEPVLTAERFDIDSGEWELLPAMSFTRNYHSTAILLPDGRIWVSGGDTDLTPPQNNQNNIEIYSPGYLFEGERPVITNSPANISYEQSFNLTVDTGIEKVLLIKPGAPTHAFDQDQRAIYLEILTSIANGGITYSIKAPADSNVAPPGYYMLFVLKHKNQSISGEVRIPSEAVFVKLS